MIFIYRISDNSYAVNRMQNATKEHCFLNFLQNIFLDGEDFLYVIADKVGPELLQFLNLNLPINSELFKVETGSNGASFRLQLSLANKIPDEEIIFLHEDDYLYRPHIEDSLNFKFNNYLVKEALTRAHYVSLYDHPDKYVLPDMNAKSKVSFTGVDETGVFITSGSHWKYVDSTTLTFATYASILKQDMETWLRHAPGNHPDDFKAFLDLQKKGRLIATPIPGQSTHADPVFCSPFTAWSKI